MGEHGDIVEIEGKLGGAGGGHGQAVYQQVDAAGLEVAGGVAGGAGGAALSSVGGQFAAIVHAVATGVYDDIDAVLLAGLAPGGHVFLALGELHVGGFTGGAGDENGLDALAGQELGLRVHCIRIAGAIGIHRGVRSSAETVNFE